MEDEIKLVHQMNREIGILNQKIDENHQIHLDNRDDVKTILVAVQDLNAKVGIQNGRVKKLEDLDEFNVKKSDNYGFGVKLNDLRISVDKLSEFYNEVRIDRVENKLVKKIVFGMVALILTTVMGALLALVIIKSK